MLCPCSKTQSLELNGATALPEVTQFREQTDTKLETNLDFLRFSIFPRIKDYFPTTSNKQLGYKSWDGLRFLELGVSRLLRINI